MRKRNIFVYTMMPLLAVAIVSLVACSPVRVGKSDTAGNLSPTDESRLARLVFDADTAYAYCARQCDFGPRTMNSTAHDNCGEWIKATFAAFGLAVESQRADLKGYDGTVLRSENIIARYKPEQRNRLLICAHWDSRPWADNDPDPANHHTPVMAANDGASGVAVMLELARILTADSIGADIGVDFVCFDAEDYGTPQWAADVSEADTWALGAQHWAQQYDATEETDGIRYEFGVLLDMVGGEGARFYKEGMSMNYAPQVVKRVWQTAKSAGYGEFFPTQKGTYVTDDHVPVNETAGIKCIDIIAYYPDCPQSTFGPTWHTVDDTMEHISVATLKAVGQTLARLLAGY